MFSKRFPLMWIQIEEEEQQSECKSSGGSVSWGSSVIKLLAGRISFQTYKLMKKHLENSRVDQRRIDISEGEAKLTISRKHDRRRPVQYTLISFWEHFYFLELCSHSSKQGTNDTEQNYEKWWSQHECISDIPGNSPRRSDPTTVFSTTYVHLLASKYWDEPTKTLTLAAKQYQKS